MSRKRKGQFAALSGALICTALLLKYFDLYLHIADGLLTAAAVIAGFPTAKSAVQSLRFRILGIEALVTAAVIGALWIQEYWEAAAVTFLFVLGSFLEAQTLDKTRASLKMLFALAPKKAFVLRNGGEAEVLPEEVAMGEHVIVRAGGRIPVDGTVFRGTASVNQAAVTGESIPVSKSEGDAVFSGTVVESGYMEVMAEKVGEDTVFSRILELIEEAQERKAPTQMLLERFSAYYTPAVLVLSAAVYLLTRDLVLSLTLLVIACPGALVISAPVSIVAGIGNGAHHGILIKGGDQLEKAGRIQVVAFDKTGTLTVGKPQVTSIKSFGLPENEVLRLAASAEVQSEHPLARAVLEEAAARGISHSKSIEEFAGVPGLGLVAQVDERRVLIGNRRLLIENQIEINDHAESWLQQEENQGQTAVLIADAAEGVLGVISISDVQRHEARQTVALLKKAGVKRIVMLTGDNGRTAAAVAEKLGIDEFFAEQLPENKVNIIKQLKREGNLVAMVGDGINDAPALAAADIGIAMGGAGTDVAAETAGIILMSDRLDKIPYTLGLSKAAIYNMKQNIYFAVAVAAVLLIGVMEKSVILASGMLIHEISVLVVILNSIRLWKYDVHLQ